MATKLLISLQLLLTALFATLLAGCAATNTALEHHNLDVQTKMSNTIFLPPAAAADKTIFVETHNTSDKQSVKIEPQLIKSLKDKGYKIVTDPQQAHYILQVNVLQIGQLSQSAAKQAAGNGFGSALVGAGTGALAGSAISDGGTRTTITGGLIGAGATEIADHMVKDITYTMITDLQIQSKVAAGQTVKSSSRSDLSQGTSTVTHESTQSSSNYQTYRTRIVSMADKVNLKFEQAAPALTQQLANSVAGLF